MKLKVLAGLLAMVALAWWFVTSNHRPLVNLASSSPESAASAITPSARSRVGSSQEPAPAPPESRPASGAKLAAARLASSPVFSAFEDWARKYVAAPAAERALLAEEGVTLARARQSALADLIPLDPERALSLAMPETLRNALPPEVRQLLEEPVSARGDYEVLCVLPPPGGERKNPAMVRLARIAGESAHVFTYGQGLERLTSANTQLTGIRVPATAATEPLPDPTGARPAWIMALMPGGAEADATTAGLEPATGTTDAPTAASPYTEGRKRFLVMRVDFPDYTVEALSTNRALDLMRDLAAFMSEISYRKHIIAPVGQGSDITPVMRMSQSVSSYDDAGLSKLYPEARQKARDQFGYDLDQYDFFYVVTGAKPAYSYAGLGYVGGVGFHLANSYFDVRTSAHEFGHNLGLGHANWWDTEGRSSIGEGDSEEYGGPFDTMGGSGGGLRHFSSYSKNKVGWIPDADCPIVRTSGVYRLYAQDVASAPTGVRGLRLERSGDDYWIEYRQLWTGNKALMNGVSLRWVGGSTILLDMTPGSAGGKEDHALTIGRTYSEPTLNFHITPLRRAHTFPESLDLAIYVGRFPTNRPPNLVVQAGALTGATGQPVSFHAEAADPNEDALAYFWDFGDGDYSVDNSPAVTHAFASPGKYYVACTVSDMKGGVARDAVLVSVGSASVYNISGRVLRPNGEPMPGIKVSAGASASAYTVGDGTYVITRLSAGSYTVTASEPVADAFSFVQPFFNNPVRVGPDFATADFIGSTNALNVYTPIVPKLSVWKYLDNGSNQGTNWRTPEFNDTAWASGAGILGYGEGNETTELQYGSSSSAKHLTYYFRKRFTVANPAAFTNLLLEVLRDDGVLVYLNGAEIFRNNLPTNTTVTYLTEATSSVEPDAYIRQNLPVSVLRAGANVLAAEIHQSDPTSSDITFDLGLSGLSLANVTGLNLVYVSSPGHNDRFAGPTNLTIRAFAQSSIAPVSGVAFYLDSTWLGEDTNAPYQQSVTLATNGAYELRVVAAVGSQQVTSAPVTIHVAEPVKPPASISLNLIAAGAVWKYLAGPEAAPDDWAGPRFSDTAWAGGAAQLGYGDNDEATRVPYGSNASQKWMTTYFRRAFVVNDPAAVTALNLRLKRDDGAVVYVNGREVLRDNMPAGAVAYDTAAADSAADDGANFNLFTLPPAGLEVGANILAVEIHQATPDSSDLSFDLGLTATASTNRSRGIWLVAPGEGTIYPSPGSISLAAEVVAGGGLGVRQVEFYANGAKIGEVTAQPLVLPWSEPPAGVPVELLAVATDTRGEAITSAPVHIQIAQPLPGAALVSSGDRWKYLDDGSDQGGSWTALSFNDRVWKVGNAPFGYGDEGEVTRIWPGGNPAQRNLTAYFRKTFVTTPSTAFQRLLLRLRADDGAVVYLNGVEVHRKNLPPGAISYNSLALASLESPQELVMDELYLEAASLRPGTNMLAVELHQASITSEDAGFDLALTGLYETNLATGVFLTSPSEGARFHLPAAIPLTAFAVAEPVGIAKVEYYQQNSKIGEAAANPYRVIWSNPTAGAHTLTVRAITESGEVMVSPPVTVFAGEAPAPVSPVLENYIPALAEWKYLDQAALAGGGWQQPEYDDSAWPSDLARFGFGLDGERTLLNSGGVSWYFRKWFTVVNPALLTELRFRLSRDDGAVIYLNGRELFRSNMPGGMVTPNTLAAAAVNTPDETTYFETVVASMGAGLVAGNNLLAVELHQAETTSSDAGFDLALDGYGTTASRVLLSAPADGAAFEQSTNVTLAALVWPGEGEQVARVEFYADGVRVGESAAAPYEVAWSSPGFGPHTLRARAWTTRGLTLDSVPATVYIGRKLVSEVLIPAQSTWKYLDNGSNQGTNWAQPKYNDASWKSGVARLGYSPNREDGERTVVSYGSSSSSKHITTYFRKLFVVPPGVVYTNLVCRLLRDDGAVVWLNGRELYRSNLPAPASVPVVAFNTLALEGVGDADEQTFFLTSAGAAHLASGTNVLAVEVHQNSASSSDLGFDFELLGAGYIDAEIPVELALRLNEGNLELTWPAAEGWQILTSTNLAAPPQNWTIVPVQPAIIDGRAVVTLTNFEPTQFFRLVKP